MSIWSLPTHHITSVKFWWSDRSLERRSVYRLAVWSDCRVPPRSEKAGQHVHHEQHGKHALYRSPVPQAFTIKVASSGHMTVLEYRRKTLRLHVRTHPDDGERRKELHIQRWCYSGRSQNRIAARVDRLSQNPPQPYNHQKYRVTSGIFRACVIWWMNMRTTRRKTGSLTETHYSRLFQPRRYRSRPVCR